MPVPGAVGDLPVRLGLVYPPAEPTPAAINAVFSTTFDYGDPTVVPSQSLDPIRLTCAVEAESVHPYIAVLGTTPLGFEMAVTIDDNELVWTQSRLQYLESNFLQRAADRGLDPAMIGDPAAGRRLSFDVNELIDGPHEIGLRVRRLSEMGRRQTVSDVLCGVASVPNEIPTPECRVSMVGGTPRIDFAFDAQDFVIIRNQVVVNLAPTAPFRGLSSPFLDVGSPHGESISYQVQALDLTLGREPVLTSCGPAVTPFETIDLTERLDEGWQVFENQSM